MKAARFLAVSILVTLVISCASLSFGVSEDELEEKIDQTKKKLTQTKIKEHSVLGNLLRTQKELDKLNSSLYSLNLKLGKTERSMELTKYQLNNTQGELNRLSSEISSQQGVLGHRVLAIYKYGYQSYLEILFNSKDFSEFISRFEMVKKFIEADLAIIKDLKQKQEMIAKKKEEYSKQQEELERQKYSFARLQNQTQLQHSRYLSKAQDTKKELSKIQNDRKLLEQALDELEELSKSMESQIRDYQNNSKVALGSGKYIWPVSGDITSYFGYRVHPILKKRKYHTGLDIAAPSGTPIAATDYGVVIFSGRNGGYGKMVSLDHGAGISSVYAHCSVLLVNKGQTVSKGQIIAKVGTTGLSTGPHLHFEVRKEGTPVNPLDYI